jgi:dTMP kinase
MNGLFITFEGIEGCGKTTQLARLQSYLNAQGRHVEVTREPGGTPLSEAIRKLLLDPTHGHLSPTAELLLYESARAQHVDERLRPALEAGAIVLCDRFADSTTAYQGAGRNLSAESVATLHQVATRGVWPDLTILIDVPVEVGLARVARAREKDRMELEPLQFHERVRAAFLLLAQLQSDRIKVVDGTRSVDDVAVAVRDLMDATLRDRRPGGMS